MEKGDETRKPAWEEGAIPFRLSPDGNRIHIHAALRGIGEEKIRLDLDAGTLIISATDGNRDCTQEISLPWEARLAGKRLENGILEITLEKADF